ncbi:MAG: hypothetical protein AABN95_15930 [Acidobacteriota bacterium]
MNTTKLSAVKRVSKAEQRRRSVAVAMPDVREICAKHGRSIVTGCLNRIAELEKKSEQIEKLRKEADALERNLSDFALRAQGAGG